MKTTRKELLAKALAMPIDKESIAAMAEELETDPQYSLEPDPTGELSMTTREKEFVRWYVQHRNIAVASQLAGISVEDGMQIYKSFACQSELTRINMAYKLRQLNMSTLTLEQIGSVLTGYVFDQLPDADQLSTKDKMAAMKMIMDIHALKQKIVEESKPLDVVDVESQVKDLSVDAIKALIDKTKTSDADNAEKEELIKKIDNESALSNEDLHYLRSLTVEDLQMLLKDQQDIKFMRHDSDPETIPNPMSVAYRGKKLTPVDKNDEPLSDMDDITGD